MYKLLIIDDGIKSADDATSAAGRASIAPSETNRASIGASSADWGSVGVSSAGWASISVSETRWASIGVSAAGRAAAGDAPNKIRAHQPDIVVAGIQTRGADGLKMIGELSLLFPSVKFIALCGRAEPEYVKKMLEMSAVTYLFAPVGEEELLEAVKGRIAEIEKERVLRDKIRLIDYELERNRRFFTDGLLDDLLNGLIKSKDELDARSALLETRFERQSYCCAVFSIPNAHRVIQEGGFRKLHRHYQAVEETIKNLWEGEAWFLRAGCERLAVIFGGESLQQGPERVLDTLGEFLDFSVAAALGEPRDSVLLLWKSYGQALLALEGGARKTPGALCTGETPEARSFRLICPAEKEDAPAFRAGDDGDPDISGPTEALFDLIERHGRPARLARAEIMRFLAALSRKAADAGRETRDIFGGDLPELYAELNKLDRREELEAWLKSRLETAGDIARETGISRAGTKIAKANQYLLSNFCDYDMSLDAVSKHLRVNPSYFSRIYKKKTGQSFVETLTAMRLEKAGALLSGTSMKIADVALAVGYQNPRYFWNIFKKVNGCSPTEYRESH